jgi:hypothetical protein
MARKAKTARRKHAHLAPSASHRWIPCPGSVALCAQLEAQGGEPEPTIYAAEGTLFHRLMMLILRHGYEPKDFLDSEMKAGGHQFTVDQEFVEHLEAGLEEVASKAYWAKHVFIEERVSLDRWIAPKIDPDPGGTLDFGWVNDDYRSIGLLDYKFGAGVPVHPRRNPQIMCYALAFWQRLVDKNIVSSRERVYFQLGVFQPRNPEGGGWWETDIDELLDWGHDLEAAAIATTKKDAPLKTGSHCEFCPAAKAGICSAYEGERLRDVQLKFDDLSQVPALKTILTPERRAYILQHRRAIEDWLENLHAQALDDALKGNDCGGLKAVIGRHPKSKWKDEDAAEKFLIKHTDMIYQPLKLLSPTQAKKVLPAKALEILDEYVDRGNPKPMLVPQDDPRPAIKSIEDKFDDLTK